jgi:hypothetical protein
MAGTTGLEPAASAVTGQRSNQLNYVPQLVFIGLAGNPRFSCLFLLATTSPVSTVFTPYHRIPRFYRQENDRKLSSVES